MNLREAAQQALEALEKLDEQELATGDIAWLGKEIGDLRVALSDTQDWDEIEALRASLREHMAEIKRLNECLTWEQHRAEHISTHGPGCAMWGPKHYECLLQEYEAMKARIERNADSGKTSDAPETNFGNMAQAVDCYGDGNVYRGQRSRDSETKTITFSKMETVEPVAWMVYTLDGQSAFITDNPADCTSEHRSLPLYTAPPKREPVATVESVATVVSESGNQEITMSWWHEPALPVGTKLYTAPPKREPLTIGQLFDLYNENAKCQEEDWLVSGWLAFAAAIERAHGIGGEE